MQKSMFCDRESGLSEDLKDGERGLREGQTLVEARGDKKGAKTNRTIWQLVSLRTAEDEQLHQVKRMRGIGHVLFSTYFQT